MHTGTLKHTGQARNTGDKRVLRGGSWNNNGRNLRSAQRNANQPDKRNNHIGFRLSQLAEPAGNVPVSGTSARSGFVVLHRGRAKTRGPNGE